MNWEAKCREFQMRVAELERENRELRLRLGMEERTVPAITNKPESPANAAVHKHSAPEEKIRLSRNLFRGREDVYARRWYSVQKAKSGYSPVCANEWWYGDCCKLRFATVPF